MGMKAKLAELLFARELDKAYQEGITEGARYATGHLHTRLYARQRFLELTKTQELGYEKAIKVVRDAKHDVRGKTGAWA